MPRELTAVARSPARTTMSSGSISTLNDEDETSGPAGDWSGTFRTFREDDRVARPRSFSLRLAGPGRRSGAAGARGGVRPSAVVGSLPLDAGLSGPSARNAGDGNAAEGSAALVPPFTKTYITLPALRSASFPHFTPRFASLYPPTPSQAARRRARLSAPIPDPSRFVLAHTPHSHLVTLTTAPMLALRPRAVAISRARTSSRIAIAARIRYYSVVVNAPIPKKTKVWDSADEAVKDVKSGDIILSGGTLTYTHPAMLMLTYAQGLDSLASPRRSSMP